MNDKFIRAYHNGFCVVALFACESSYMYSDGVVSRGFVLAASALRERIANRIKYGMSTVEEVAALSAIKVIEDGQETLNANSD